MQSVKDIKNRIKSVSETAQITRAMELISAAKMQKASARYNSSQAYFTKVRKIIYDIVKFSDFDEPHPYLTRKKEGKHAYLIIGSDKGMSGDYNHAVISFASETVEKDPESEVLCIGETVFKHFTETRGQVEKIACSQEGTLEDARIIATRLVEDYKQGIYSEINIIYMSLVSKSRQKCAMIRLLPILSEDFDVESTGYISRLEFLPDAESVFGILVPQYFIGILYGCITAGKYTEHLERMRAMNSATKNASELLDELQINYNKARQEKITTEITELSAVLLEKD